MSEQIEIKCPYCDYTLYQKNLGAVIKYAIICVNCNKLFLVSVNGAIAVVTPEESEQAP